ncbi:MAG: sortase domain-containing protein [Sporichthyaceae bacterium]
MARDAVILAAAAALAAAALVGCASGPDGGPLALRPAAVESADPIAPEEKSPDVPAVTPQAEPEPAFVPSDGQPRRATLTISKLGIRDLAVEPYRGRTDDAPGTVIQDGGIAASPHGPRGGIGPGGIGNYQVTAHRTSSTRAFEFLPDLAPGDRVVVRAGGTRYVYEIRSTRRTSFRSAQSLAEQRAAVPGRPGAEPRDAFITLSTCATPEDRAAGNFWTDEFKNPEHRIDKIGVLIRSQKL